MVDSRIDWNKNRTTWSSVLDKVHIPPPTSEQQWTSPSTPFSWPWCHSTRNHWAQKLLKSQANQKNKLWRGAVQKRSSTGIVLVTRVLAGLLPGSVLYIMFKICFEMHGMTTFEMRFLSYDLMLRDENEIFQYHALRWEFHSFSLLFKTRTNFFLSISGFKTITRIKIKIILARIFEKSFLLLASGLVFSTKTGISFFQSRVSQREQEI